MKELVINVNPLETRIALLDDGSLIELHIERAESRSVVGNIYKGRVDSIVPGIQAAFVDFGSEKNGFLYVSDIAGAEGTGDFDFENGRAIPRSRKGRQPKIESILKKDQKIMVQVEKDTLGTKGARLTNYITLPGRYTVLMPTVTGGGISRKIDNDKERDRLKKILNSVKKKNTGLITRTAAEGKSRKEIESDVRSLNKQWTTIKNKMDRMKGVGLLHGDLGPVLRIVRDIFTDDIDRLTVDEESEYSRILNFLDSFAPPLKKRCRYYKLKRPIFDKFGVEEQVEMALRRQVQLKSGGSICIDQTEALIAIDVNTGRYTGKKGGLEQTVFKTNMEAAKEIARQVRLRDMGGIIVIDFIDMEIARNRRELLKTFQDCLKKDRATTTLSEINELGMIEMTRKRVRQNLMKTLTQPCPYCEGSGAVKSVTTMTADTLRRLQSLFCNAREKRVILQVHPDVARRLRHEDKELLEEVAERFKREISVESVSDFHIHDIRVLNERTRKEVTA